MLNPILLIISDLLLLLGTIVGLFGVSELAFSRAHWAVRTMAEPQRYRVYLLRLWQVLGDDGIPIWRAALEEAHTSERHGFGTLVELVTFLESQTVHWNQEASLSESET